MECAFNRPIVELKHITHLISRDTDNPSFNRTIVELKLEQAIFLIEEAFAFNRPIVELKHNPRLVSNVGPETFNRPIVELKRMSGSFSHTISVFF